MATSHLSSVLPGRRATLFPPSRFRFPTVNVMTCERQEFAGKHIEYLSVQWAPARGQAPRAGSREPNRLRRFGLRLRSLARTPAPRAGGGPTAPAKTRPAGRDGDGAWRGECDVGHGSRGQVGTPSFLHLRLRWACACGRKGCGTQAVGLVSLPAATVAQRRQFHRRGDSVNGAEQGFWTCLEHDRSPSGWRFSCCCNPQPSRRPMR